jgi:hypothetical protein
MTGIVIYCARCGNEFPAGQVCDTCRRSRARDALLWLSRKIRAGWLAVFGDIRRGHGGLPAA